MPRVLIIVPGIHSYEPAREYGELVEVLPGRHNPFQTDELKARLIGEFDKLKVTADDYLMLCGHQVLNTIAIALFQERFGKIRMLVYGAKHQDYVARDIVVPSERPRKE